MGIKDLFRKRGGGPAGEPGEETFLEGLHVVHDDPANPAIVDIVFIHGITGSPFRSWAKDPTQPPWIGTLLPTRIPRARILTFGYDAQVSGVGSRVKQLSLRNHAEDLVYDIAQDGQRKADPSALVLANEDPDDSRRAMFRCTHGIAFFGTPMRGSDIAGLANVLRALLRIAGDTNKKILGVLDRSSEELRAIQMSFRRLLRSPRPHGLQNLNLVCFYEAHTMYPLGLIVEEASATLEDYPQRSIDANHIDMVRFSSPNDPGFKALAAMLDNWVGELPSSRVSPTGSSADDWFQRGDRRYNDYLASGPGGNGGRSAQLKEAIFYFTEAAKLADIARPRDHLTYTRSHLGIARCRRELTFKKPSSYAKLTGLLDDAASHLHRAYDAAGRMDSSALRLRVELELAVIGARRVQVEEKESRLAPQAIASQREEAVKELARVIADCVAAQREDLQEYGTKWLVKLGGEAPRLMIESS